MNHHDEIDDVGRPMKAAWCPCEFPERPTDEFTRFHTIEVADVQGPQSGTIVPVPCRGCTISQIAQLRKTHVLLQAEIDRRTEEQ